MFSLVRGVPLYCLKAWLVHKSVFPYGDRAVSYGEGEDCRYRGEKWESPEQSLCSCLFSNEGKKFTGKALVPHRRCQKTVFWLAEAFGEVTNRCDTRELGTVLSRSVTPCWFGGRELSSSPGRRSANTGSTLIFCLEPWWAVGVGCGVLQLLRGGDRPSPRCVRLREVLRGAVLFSSGTGDKIFAFIR